MILRAILDKYAEGISIARTGITRAELAELEKSDPMLAGIAKKARIGTGNPTGSAAGKCCAQLQMLRFPSLTHPEYIRPRAIMTFENGDLLENWWSEKIKLAYPGLSGLHQMVFYFPVPVTPPEHAQLKARINARYGSPGAIWGKVIPGFQPPFLRMGDNGKPIYRRAANEMMGFVLTKDTLWVPTFIDEAIFHHDLGITIIEKKAVSSFAFRKMVLGQLDYQKQCQLAVIAEASGLNVALLAYRKDTAHLLEIAYVRGAHRTQVRILRSNGVEEDYWAENGSLYRTDTTETADVPADNDWEAGAVWTPYDQTILRQIRERVLRVLLVNPGEWFREYGPRFICRVCDGTGTQTRQKGKHELLKKAKPCEDCGQTGKTDEADLGFPCSFCSVVMYCYRDAEVRREISAKPRLIVKRAAYEASGLTFYQPGGFDARPEEPAD